jgi:hypothetical protein
MKFIRPFWFACGLIICLASVVFAGSTLESTISTSGWLSTALEQISAERMLEDIRTLSGPLYGGRLTGKMKPRPHSSPIASVSCGFIALLPFRRKS